MDDNVVLFLTGYLTVKEAVELGIVYPNGDLIVAEDASAETVSAVAF